MTTRELCDLLMKLDPTGKLEVIETRCSDYGSMPEDAWSVVAAVMKPSARYVMRAHPTMSKEDVEAARSFVHYAGN